MKRAAALLVGLAAAAFPLRLRAEEAVVLLHGIMNKPFFMGRIESVLAKEGYRVHNWGYPSTEKTIEELSAEVEAYVAGLPPAEKIHFVGFSLGSQVLRHYLARRPPVNAGRFVMIAPPNRGSPLVDLLRRHEAVRWIYGEKAFLQLSSRNRARLDGLGKPLVPFGIIAGGLGDGRGFSPALPGDDDGTVPLESALMAGAADTLVLPHEHTWLLLQAVTARQAAAFLKAGRFDRE